MKTILKSIVVSASPKRWNVFRQKFHEFFKGRDPLFDQIISFVNDYFLEFETFPTPKVITDELERTGETTLLGYISAILNDVMILPIIEDSEFFSKCSKLKEANYELDLLKLTREFNDGGIMLEQG